MFPIGNLSSALVAYHQSAVAGNNHTDLTKYRAQCASLYHICNDNQRQDQFLIVSKVRSNSFGQTAKRRGIFNRGSRPTIVFDAAFEGGQSVGVRF